MTFIMKNTINVQNLLATTHEKFVIWLIETSLREGKGWQVRHLKLSFDKILCLIRLFRNFMTFPRVYLGPFWRKKCLVCPMFVEILVSWSLVVVKNELMKFLS